MACSSESRSIKRFGCPTTCPKPGVGVNPRARIVRERLAAAVENHAVGGRLADHHRQHDQRAIIERGGAERDLRAIEVDVVAGPILGEAFLLNREARRRRCARADLVDRDAGLAAPIGERASWCAPRPPPCLAFRLPNVRDRRGPRATAGPCSRRPGSAATPRIISHRAVRGRIDAAAMEPDVDLDEHVDLLAGARHGVGPLLRDRRDDRRRTRDACDRAARSRDRRSMG